MFCSTIIPTVGRSTLSQAVESVLDQEFPRDLFEVIVVNDTGRPLPEMAWQRSERVTILTSQRRERCVARNAGAAIARGAYLHFLDDDDQLLPGAVQAFWKLSQAGDAAWLCGSYQTVDDAGTIRECHPYIESNMFALLVAGEGIPLQASLLQADAFFAVGAFDPRLVNSEDRDVGRRIAIKHHVAKTPAVVARVRVGQQGSTTDWSVLASQDRLGREKALSELGAWACLRAAATSGELHGRISRAYLASARWNLEHRNWGTALNRALAAVGFAGWHAIEPAFWHGLGTRIVSGKDALDV